MSTDPAPPANRPVARLRELALNAGLTTSTVARHLGDDPLLLLVQTSRRLPAWAVRALTRALLAQSPAHGGARPAATVRRALGHWLAGSPELAAETIRGVLARRSSSRWPTGARGRVLAELAVQLGAPDLLAAATDGAPSGLRARAAWTRGDVSRAVAEAQADGARSRAMAARLESEARLLQPGPVRGAPPRTVADPPVDRRGTTDLGVFHLLTNSLPHTQSGYALRSHSVLTAQRDAGLRVAASTRLGYPVTVGRAAARHLDVVDGVAYHRVIPWRAAPDADLRVRQHADLLLPLVDRWAPDVVHTTTNFVNALVARDVAGRLGVPWVYEVRGLLEETWVASRPAGAERARAAGSERHTLLRARETEVALSADHVVTLSATLRDELVGRGLPPHSVTVVPNAVDAALLDATTDATDARRAVGLPPEGFWVGTVSSLVDYEGLDTLIDAVAELRARGLDARALVVGDGVSRAALERRAADHGLGGHAVFTGRVPRGRAPAFHRALDVFAVPRRDVRVCRRVTPLKPTEAMAVGRPVVASDLPALAELVQPHGSGLLVPPDDALSLADALHRLHDSPDLRAELAAAGRTFAASRTWSAAGAAYRALYRELAGEVTA